MDRGLIIGATGLLGCALANATGAVRGAREAPEQEGWVQVDLDRPEELGEILAQCEPSWVVNTAAITSVDACEANPEAARRIHVDAVKALAEACGARGISLFQLSTNYVFDGKGGPYGEADATNPLNVYGETKLEGERVALAACEATILRTAVLYGFDPTARPNFVAWVVGALRRGETIRVVTDEGTHPTYVPELVKIVEGLIGRSEGGIYHAAGADFLTRFEMVEAICAVFGLPPSLVQPIVSADLGQLALRPLSTGLRLNKLRATVDVDLAPFRSNLAVLRGLLPADPGRS